jgi:anti-sigma regulatory factor (Ser/Thr protein kinase)/anti-anti-sigma regulatory factor
VAALTTTVSRDLEADVTIVRAYGRLDLVTAPLMRAALLKCVAECPSAVVVDISGCATYSAAALAVFPAVGTGQAGRPAVTIVLCGTDDRFLPTGGRAALGDMPTYGTCIEALTAAEQARSTQRCMRLHAVRSLSAPGRARVAIGEACDEWDLSHLRIPAVLIISELVTNAVCHASTDVDIEAIVRGDFLHLRVRDGSPVPPTMSSNGHGSMPSDHGRGLPIVAHYSVAWGFVVNSTGTGKVVWATLRARPLGSHAAAADPPRRGSGDPEV